jgi:enamine deaminase RidA (YjgF/YER057c/UK114 family)
MDETPTHRLAALGLTLDAGRHARLAVGVSSLPYDIALEIEVIAEAEG